MKDESKRILIIEKNKKKPGEGGEGGSGEEGAEGDEKYWLHIIALINI